MAVQGGLGRENSGCGRGRLNILSAELTGRSRGAGTTSVVLYWYVVYNKLIVKIGPASLLYAPGEVPRGSQARPRRPRAAGSPPKPRTWTWVARGSMGMGSPQSTAEDDAGGGPKSAYGNAARSYRRSLATGSASRWSGPTPVRRAPSEKLARRLASAPPDQLCSTR